MDWLKSTFGPLFAAVASVFQYLLDRSRLKNSPKMQSAAEAQKEIEAVNKAEQAVKNEQIEEIRKQLGE